jgi:hypothetical protein
MYKGLNRFTGALEAVQAKRSFERIAQQSAATIRRYCGDNSVFATMAWKASCDAYNQITIKMWRQCPSPKWHC